MIPVTTDWRNLYHAAILETDQKLVRKRVLEAEQAALAREREIHNDGECEEKEHLEYALYVLRAYKNAWQHTQVA
jgi:hypothetical protein